MVIAGGMIGDYLGIRRPFEVAFCSLLLSTIYVRVALPFIAPETISNDKSGSRGLSAFFSPLRLLAPQKVCIRAVVRNHHGILFLCAGVFLGVVRLVLLSYNLNGSLK